MWIHSHKDKNSKDKYVKFAAFLAVQFACIAWLMTQPEGADVAVIPRSSRAAAFRKR